MYKFILTLLVFVWTSALSAQELKCKVIISAEQVAGANPQVFKTMETTINDFMNQTKWTSKIFENNERIECSILFTLIEQTGTNVFSGSVQVQSSRPVFNSIYTTPILNYKDEDLTFSYNEFEPLQFEINSYQSELVSTLSYFAYLIIGLDADTFSLNGGDEYFNTCQKIVDQVDNPNSKKAWKSNTNKFNRYQFLNKLTSPSFKNYRNTLYQYHINGLDKMADDSKTAKESIMTSLTDLNTVFSMTMGAQLVRTFMDAKSDEIVDIFSDGPVMETKNLISILNRIAPTSAQKWEKIK